MGRIMSRISWGGGVGSTFFILRLGYPASHFYHNYRAKVQSAFLPFKFSSNEVKKNQRIKSYIDWIVVLYR